MRKPIILDTDIGPDCDDTGALAMLNVMHNAGVIRLCAVTHCTSNPYGSGCADAINKWYGNDIPVGTLPRAGFLDDDNCRRYNKYICENYDNRYKTSPAPPAVAVLRKTLSEEPDGSVTVCAIGPLTNLHDLLLSTPDEYSDLGGTELVKRKVSLFVCMGGCDRFAEYNFHCDTRASSYVCANWPGEIVFSTFEVGENVITGKQWGTLPENHPVRMSFSLYAPDGRNSWDQTAAYYAALGGRSFFGLSGRGVMSVDEQTGKNTFTETPQGPHRCMKNLVADELIAAGIDRLMQGIAPEKDD